MWEWNKYEIVLLIEAVKQINNGAARGTTLKKLSKKLRRMAKNRGRRAIQKLSRNEHEGSQYRIFNVRYRGQILQTATGFSGNGCHSRYTAIRKAVAGSRGFGLRKEKRVTEYL